MTYLKIIRGHSNRGALCYTPYDFTKLHPLATKAHVWILGTDRIITVDRDAVEILNAAQVVLLGGKIASCQIRHDVPK